MTWNPKDEEIKAVLLLDSVKRYEYCIKKAADQLQVWSLRQEDGWALARDNAGREVVSIWPHLRFATMCASGTWCDYIAEFIEMDAWLDRWLPGLEMDHRLVAVFPTPQNQGVVVEPGRLAVDLRDELSQYE